MRIIESIEIKYFRSFADKKVEMDSISDLNIISGANDSGKSNVLRALNLFFNNETSPGFNFNIDNDLSKIHWHTSDSRVKEKRDGGKTEARQKDLYVDIKIHFLLPDNFGGMLPKKFFVSRRWTKTKYLYPTQESNVETRYKKEKGELTTNQKNALQGQLTQFLHKIDFRYVPAVKDRSFFKHLYKELQGKLLEREISKIKEKSDELQGVIKEETKELFAEFKKSTGLDASFLLLEENTIDFSKSVEVETVGNIYLTSRGDGVQARFIPDVLNELSKGSKKKFVVWGFEEPEGSYELKNIKKLRDNFVDIYSVDKQIFITTHSREFLSIQEKNKQSNCVSIYRVFKKVDNSSQIAFCDDDDGFDEKKIQQSFWGTEAETEVKKTELEELFNDLGIIDESRKIIELEDLLNKNKNNNSELSKVIDQLKKSTVFVEDEKINLYKIAWLKLQKIKINSTNFINLFEDKAPFVINPAGGRNELQKKLDMPKLDEYQGKIVIGVFDFDDAYNNFNGLSNTRWSTVAGNRQGCLYKNRTDYKNVFSILIPVPKNRSKYVTQNANNNYLFLEHLFKDSSLKKSNHFEKMESVGGGGKILKIKDKSKLWISSLDFKENEFNNFKPLFDRINTLLNSVNI